jgi:hypothetical protein
MTGSPRSGWIPGLVVGAAGGMLSLVFPTVGWLIVAGFAVPALVGATRVAALGGLLTGIGAIWLALLGRVALQCRGDEGCQAPNQESWLVAAALMLGIGLALRLATVARSRGVAP